LAAAAAALDADLERYLVIQGTEYKESVEEDLQEMEDAVTNLQSTAVTDDDQQALADIEFIVSQLQIRVENVIKLQESDASSGEITRIIVAIYSDIDRLQELQENLSDQTIATIQSTAEAQSVIASNVVTQSVILGIIVVVITIIATVTTDRRLRPIVSLTNTTTAIAEGDFSQVAPVESKDEIGTLATSFNTMTGQLRETLKDLEIRIEDRTRALETSTEVSRRLSTILDQDQLVREVVEQLRSAFGYYHAQIYLFDELKQNLEMVGGTGDAGRTMLARGHTIEGGRGLVGRAAQTNQIVLISDISRAVGWLPNPLLPDTKAEVAVPIAVGDEVLGVMDVQHNVADGLSQQDANLIQAIANQVAVAVTNAQAYEQAQRQATRETQILSITQRIQSANSIDDVLKIAVRELGEALGADRADIEVSMEKQSNGGSHAS